MVIESRLRYPPLAFCFLTIRIVSSNRDNAKYRFVKIDLVPLEFVTARYEFPEGTNVRE